MILVVDDIAEIREVFRRALTSAGYDVIEASDGLDGVRLAALHHPDLVIMDISLPGLDGLSAVRRLKADRATAEIPVIVVSGDSFAAARARAAGGALFLPKPVRLADLLSAVARTITSPVKTFRERRQSSSSACDTAADARRTRP